MKTVSRGFGVSAMIDRTLLAPLAAAAERAGYATFWVNDVPGGNGLEQLQKAQNATATIRLGIGVLPVDRWSAGEIQAEIDRLRLDPTRLAIGIGAGALHGGSLDATGAVAEQLLSITPARVLIGALGPAMCRLAGSAAHGVILNWLTASAAAGLAELTREGAAAKSRPAPEVVAYVRTAANPAAQDRLNRESAAYEGYPAYARHFARMGVGAIETTANGTADSINRNFAAFSPAVNEVVARAIVAGDTLADYLDVLHAAQPAPAR